MVPMKKAFKRWDGTLTQQQREEMVQRGNGRVEIAAQRQEGRDNGAVTGRARQWRKGEMGRRRNKPGREGARQQDDIGGVRRRKSGAMVGVRQQRIESARWRDGGVAATGQTRSRGDIARARRRKAAVVSMLSIMGGK